MSMMECVEVVRGSVVESRHRIHAAVVDAAGTVRATVGDPGFVTYFRSAAKPFQALPIVTDGAMDRLGITLEELALCCGSHSGEERHLKVAASLLRKAGVEGEALACGAHAPFHRGARRALADAGIEPVRMHNNCSGKHAGMIALARSRGWDPEGYHRVEHPVQQRIIGEITEWVRMPEEALALGVDGCGVVTFGLPLRNMALAYAQLARGARAGDRDATYLVGAMVNFPEMVAGEGRLCTDLMEASHGRLFAKTGAEGVYCVGVPGAELGVALKVEDGSTRALAPAVLAVLRQLDLISEDDLGALYAHAFPELRNSRGEVVGQIRAELALSVPATAAERDA